MRALAWTLVQEGHKVLVISADGWQDQLLGVASSVGWDEMLLYEREQEGKVAESAIPYQFAKSFHPRLSVMASSKLYPQDPALYQQIGALGSNSQEVVLSTMALSDDSVRWLLVPPDLRMLKKKKRQWAERQPELILVNFMAQENICQDIRQGYATFFSAPFTLLPLCPLCQREDLYGFDAMQMLRSPYGRAVHEAAKTLDLGSERGASLLFRHWKRWPR